MAASVQPAEYGGFTGAIINTVTKSGGNAFSGLFSMRYTNDSLASDNISHGRADRRIPGLGEAAITKKLADYTVQMGGPIKKDKAFFFASIQRYSATTDPTGPVANSQDISPRFNMKFTLQPTATDTIVLGTQYDSYNVTGRVGYWPAAQATRSADGDGGCARVGVERAVAEGDRHEHVPRGEVHGLHRLLLPRSDRSVAVHLRRRYRRIQRRRRRTRIRGSQPQPGAGRRSRGMPRRSDATR